MWKQPILALLVLLIAPRLGFGEDAMPALDGVSKAMGEVNSLQYSGSGAFFVVGQSFTPGEPWPRFGLKSYTRTIDYQTPALRDEVVRAEGDPVARGGGLPIPGGQRLMTAPARPDPANVSLCDNIERLNLAVDQILPLHGRKVPLAELQKRIVKAS
jgi:hypothetical protein